MCRQGENGMGLEKGQRGHELSYQLKPRMKCQKGSIEIILPKYYTFINNTSRGCIYILSL
jgi:hypothetical protein